MNTDGQRYVYETVTVVRGREASTISKKQADGWELHRRDQGRVRTSLTFRKARKPLPKGLIGLGSVAAVVLIAVLGAVAAFGGFDDNVDQKTTQGDSAAGQDPAPPEDDSAGQSEDPSPSASESDTAEDLSEPLTVKSSPDLRELLTSPEDYGLSRNFAREYEGRLIKFDGNVAFSSPHDGYDTRFDFLIYAGDYSETEANPGPAFQFRDVNFLDLNLRGAGDSVGTGSNLTMTAAVGDFEGARTGLFLLEPVSTRLR